MASRQPMQAHGSPVLRDGLGAGHNVLPGMTMLVAGLTGSGSDTPAERLDLAAARPRSGVG